MLSLPHGQSPEHRASAAFIYTISLWRRVREGSAYTHTHTHTHTCVCMYACMYADTYTHAYTHIHIHALFHAHSLTHSLTHGNIHVRKCAHKLELDIPDTPLVRNIIRKHYIAIQVYTRWWSTTVWFTLKAMGLCANSAAQARNRRRHGAVSGTEKGTA